ncbi:MAG: hypothetical protein AAF823_02050 [Planctomycetota bacterium]
MTTPLQTGQCGLCAHFGEHSGSEQLVQIRTSKQAPADLTDACGHPKLADVNLTVTAISGCDGFEPAAAA